jgi:hypothetical protein
MQEIIYLSTCVHRSCHATIKSYNTDIKKGLLHLFATFSPRCFNAQLFLIKA